jgi:hypothetical protein
VFNRAHLDGNISSILDYASEKWSRLNRAKKLASQATGK